MSCNVTCQEPKDVRCQNQTDHVSVAVYSVVCILGIPLNVLALVVFFCCTKSRSHTIVYMTNLAIADLLLLCTLPLRIYYYLGFQDLDKRTCEVAGLILLANMYGSILLLTCVSLDRCLAVCFPMSSRVREGRKKAPLVCLGIWMLTVGASLPIYLTNLKKNENQTNCFRNFPKYATNTPTLASTLTVGFGMPLIIMILCSWGLVRAVSKSTAVQMSDIIDSCKIQRMISINLAIFLCCFLPYHVMLVVIHSYNKNEIIPCSVMSAYYYALMVTCLNAILDPLAYYFTTETFRKNVEMDAVRRMLPMNNLSSDGNTRFRALSIFLTENYHRQTSAS